MFRRCVVFIDDEKDILQLLKQMLSSEDIDVHCFPTIQNVFNQIEKIAPGIVFIDYKMAEHNGIVLLSKLKKILPHSKMIILTGEGNEMIAVQAIKAGADDYLVKPIHQDRLKEIIAHYFHEFFAQILPLNEKYIYPFSDIAIMRYEFLRAAYSSISKSIKGVCNFFSFSRQDFYNYDKRFKVYGPIGLLKKKDFEKLPYHYERKKEKALQHDPQHDPLRKCGFIDPHDDVQVKLEMLREAAITKKPNICDISEKYGFTREAFYQIYRRFQTEGLLALTEKKKGRPKQRSHSL